MPPLTMPVHDIRPARFRWLWPLLAVSLGTLYAVSMDTGAISSRVSSSSMYLHELFHDGRHLLGVPCH